MESFFPSLKTERTARKNHRTRNEANADVFDYIEQFYNTTRRHSQSDTSARLSSNESLVWLNWLSTNRQQLSHDSARP